VPVDYRLYDKAGDDLTKNDHFKSLLKTAQEHGFAPECVAFDSGYGNLENLKQIRELGWVWLTRLKGNRLVNQVVCAPWRGSRPMLQERSFI